MAPASVSETWNNLPDSFTLGLDGAAEAAGVLYLFRHGRYVSIDDATGNASAPVAINTFANWPTTATSYNISAYQGMIIYQATENNGGAVAQYPNFDHSIWTPTLTHAPSGVVGALWGVNQMSSEQPIGYGAPTYHDGTGWQQSLGSSTLFTHIAAGVITAIQTFDTWDVPLGEEPALPPFRHEYFFPRIALAAKP